MKNVLVVIICLVSFTQTFSQRWWFVEESSPRIVYAANLNGSNEYLSDSSPSGLDLGTNSLTALIWFNSSSIATDQRLFCYRGASNGYELSISSSKLAYFLSDGTANSGSMVSPNMLENEWILAVLVIDQTSDSLRMHYVENGIVYSNAFGRTINAVNPSTTFTIGRYNTAGISYFNGQIGEAQFIKGKALSRSEIKQAYLRGYNGLNFASSYSGGTIIAWYKWAGASDAEFLNDDSASNNDLTGNNVTRSDDQVTISGGYK